MILTIIINFIAIINAISISIHYIILHFIVLYYTLLFLHSSGRKLLALLIYFTKRLLTIVIILLRGVRARVILSLCFQRASNALLQHHCTIGIFLLSFCVVYDYLCIGLFYFLLD